MKKILLTFLVTAILMASLFLFGTGYFLGGYVVQFGLQRGPADNHQAPPRAYARIMPPSLTGYTKPDFPAEDWHLEAADGTNLAGTHFSPRGWSHRWAIVVHGYGCTQANSWYLASHYLHMGYHVVTPDLRGAGMSDGGFVTLGHDESRDIHLWAEKIVEQDPQAKIVLHGVSMGAATVMLAAAGSDATRAADEAKAAQAVLPPRTPSAARSPRRSWRWWRTAATPALTTSSPGSSRAPLACHPSRCSTS